MHVNDILEMLRRNNFRGSSLLTQETGNQRDSIGPYIMQNLKRQKAGVIKEHH